MDEPVVVAARETANRVLSNYRARGVSDLRARELSGDELHELRVGPAHHLREWSVRFEA